MQYNNFSPKIPRILDIVNINGHNVAWIRDKVIGDSSNARILNKAIEDLARAKVAKPSEDTMLWLMTPNTVLTALQQQGFDFDLRTGGLSGGIRRTNSFPQNALKFGDTKQTSMDLAFLPQKGTLLLNVTTKIENNNTRSDRAAFVMYHMY